MLTPLEAGLSPKERARLGAHFTPEDLARLVVTETLEPLVDDQRRQTDPLGFHEALRAVRILDPACGTGHLLGAALDLLQDLEHQAFAALTTRGEPLPDEVVTPAQLIGLDRHGAAVLEARGALGARGLARWQRLHGRPPPLSLKEAQPKVEIADAVLGPDGRAPTWPEADYLVANPPFVGNKAMRRVLGEGYAEALRRAWPEVPSSAELALYWWHRAAVLVGQGALRAAGLITPNTLGQPLNRPVVEARLGAVVLATVLADHPWEGAAVRVAVTVLRRPGDLGREPVVVTAAPTGWQRRSSAPIGAHLGDGPDLAGLGPLAANGGRSFQGMNLVGQGFRLSQAELEALEIDPQALPAVVRPYQNAMDFLTGAPPRYVIDLHGWSLEEAERAWPRLVAHLRREVWPERQNNARRAYRERWWQFAEPRVGLRAAIAGLPRYLVTPITARWRVWGWAPAAMVPDCQLVVVASADPADLAVLSSRPHRLWSEAAGSFRGAGHDLRYRNGPCYESFPFPTASGGQRTALAALGTALEAARQRDGRPLGLQARAPSAEILVLHENIDSAVTEAYGWSGVTTDREWLESLRGLHLQRRAAEPRG